VEYKNNNDLTPLDLALSLDNKDITNILIPIGATQTKNMNYTHYDYETFGQFVGYYLGLMSIVNIIADNLFNSYDSKIIVNNSKENTLNCFNETNLNNCNLQTNCALSSRGHKCVPKCNNEDCETINIRQIINITPEQKKYTINSMYDGNVFFIFKIKFVSKITFIVFKCTDSDDIIIAVGPGRRLLKNELQSYITKELLDELLGHLISENIPNRRYIFMGHSMGCMIIQFIGTLAFLKDNNIYDKCYFIGTGSRPWEDDKQSMIKFIKTYAERFMFFCNCVKENNEFNKDSHVETNKITFLFPTILLLSNKYTDGERGYSNNEEIIYLEKLPATHYYQKDKKDEDIILLSHFNDIDSYDLVIPSRLKPADKIVPFTEEEKQKVSNDEIYSTYLINPKTHILFDAIMNNTEYLHDLKEYIKHFTLNKHIFGLV
jgi:hypothetical protein